jgi:hypothetical protein
LLHSQHCCLSCLRKATTMMEISTINDNGSGTSTAFSDDHKALRGNGYSCGGGRCGGCQSSYELDESEVWRAYVAQLIFSNRGQWWTTGKTCVLKRWSWPFFIGFVQALVAAACNFLFAYMILTIVVTLWRKKFRKQVAISDNDWHDRCTDSLVNFETVKYVHSLSRATPCWRCGGKSLESKWLYGTMIGTIVALTRWSTLKP